MGPDIDKSPAGAKHAFRFCEHRAEVIEVRMGQHRYDGIERPVREGEIRSVSFDVLRPGLLRRSRELISRDVHSHNTPISGDKTSNAKSGAAAKVEAAAAASPAKKFKDRRVRYSMHRQTRHMSAIPVGQPVVPRPSL